MYIPTGKIIKTESNTIKIGTSEFPESSTSNNVVLSSQLSTIESLSWCLKNGKEYLPIIIGEHGTGKTEIIKTVAELHGKKLKIMGANQAMDATDLLGSFEQDTPERFIREVIERYVPKVADEIVLEDLDNVAKFLTAHLMDYSKTCVENLDKQKNDQEIGPDGEAQKSSSGGSFRWIDSELIEGLEDGSYAQCEKQCEKR